ncbi:Chemotaxis protein methyltransferase CheR [Minicystis rosea]|nr:Chemotaxis protein methyltransferase CheR [Minicystis rosea]
MKPEARGGTGDEAGLAALLEQHLGFTAEGLREHELAVVLRDRLRATGCASLDAYRRHLEVAEAHRAEIAALAARLTVGETYFFREASHLAALVAAVRGGLGHGAPRILSAGCSSGEEAHSITIALREALGPGAGGVRVHGIDVNPLAIERARLARYSTWALRSTPEPLRERYFRPQSGETFELAAEIRKHATFEERNLLAADPSFWKRESFDAIFCRNVFIYLSRRSIGVVLERFAEVLAPGGLLFLGCTETIGRVSEAFEVVRSPDLAYFRRRADDAPPARAPEPAADAAWIQSIDARARRLGALAARSPVSAPAARPRSAPSFVEGADVDVALQAVLVRVRDERFDEALALLEQAPLSGAGSSEVRITRAVILANRGDFSAAEQVCREVLSRDPGYAAAHYFLGLCREHAGEAQAALGHYRNAVARDPAFALAHLRLGILARGAGDRSSARTALEAARRWMPDEDEHRIALFGGGFRRDALQDVCIAALDACGGNR